MRLLTLGITALLGTAGMSAILAQTVDGLDVQAVKKRAADLQAEAQAFVDQVKDRGDEFREQATVVRKSGMDNMQLIADTARAGGVVVFRGFPNNSAKEFVNRLGQVVQKDDMPNIGIDPRLFRAFNVQAVPTYVAVSSTFDLCAGFHCQTKVPPYDRIEGNVTVDYALNTFAGANGPGARIASVALGNLARSRQQ